MRQSVSCSNCGEKQVAGEAGSALDGVYGVYGVCLWLREVEHLEPREEQIGFKLNV